MQPYLVDLGQGGMKYGSVSEQRLAEVYTDGRVAGLVNEHLLESIFRNLTVVSDKAAPYDLAWEVQGSSRLHTLEARGITGAGGVNFLPSDQKGKGRRKDLPAYHARRDALDGYVLVDVRQSPRFKVLGLHAHLAPTKGNWTLHEWNRMLGTWRLPPVIHVARTW